MHSGHDLPEEVSGLPLAEPSPLADVIIQLSFAGIFHDDHNLIFVLKHCGEGKVNKQTLLPSRINQDCREGARETSGDVTEPGGGWGCHKSVHSPLGGLGTMVASLYPWTSLVQLRETYLGLFRRTHSH